jgi:hypothetical protein
VAWVTRLGRWPVAAGGGGCVTAAGGSIVAVDGVVVRGSGAVSVISVIAPVTLNQSNSVGCPASRSLKAAETGRL